MCSLVDGVMGTDDGSSAAGELSAAGVGMTGGDTDATLGSGSGSVSGVWLRSYGAPVKKHDV